VNPPPAASRRRLLWPTIVIGLLVGHAALILGAVTLAVSDRSFAVVPDYYDKAVHFDERRAALDASRKLGWALSFAFEPATDDAPSAIVARLTDRDGRPVADADLQVRASSRADATIETWSFTYDVERELYVCHGVDHFRGRGWYDLDAEARVGALSYVEERAWRPAGPGGG
jgi:hypothetical protein